MKQFCLLISILFWTHSAQAEGEKQIAIFAGGCFWCVESDFDHVKGVEETISGYIGGKNDFPTYYDHTQQGHLEAVKITFDPDIITYEEMVTIFLRTVDVTDAKGQFCDRGNSYTTAVFARSTPQAEIARMVIDQGEQSLGKKIVTPVIDEDHRFWPAEDYHQDYYQKNPLRYRYYRYSCGRNATVERIWGEDAYQGLEKGES